MLAELACSFLWACATKHPKALVGLDAKTVVVR
jgi:hypothetical protein